MGKNFSDNSAGCSWFFPKADRWPDKKILWNRRKTPAKKTSLRHSAKRIQKLYTRDWDAKDRWQRQTQHLPRFVANKATGCGDDHEFRARGEKWLSVVVPRNIEIPGLHDKERRAALWNALVTKNPAPPSRPI
jgi:hypothetical protein